MDAHTPNAPASIRLNPEQELALTAMLDFITDPSTYPNFFVLSGFAGTGKTFLMREVIARANRSRASFAFTAPTNKAAKVLRAITGDACTIYSLLGLRVDNNGEVKEIVTSTKPVDLSSLDVIFVDEGSMVNKKLCHILEEQAELHYVKVIFMGDIAQLPPVKEAASPIWTSDWPTSTLTKVMRHDNQILKLVTKIREVGRDFLPTIEIKGDHTNEEGVWKLTHKAFKESIWKAATLGWFADTNKTKVIAWRNVRVGEYNDLIRNALYGAEAVPGFYLPGERIIATAPCTLGDETLLATDDEAFVQSIIETTHPIEKQYKALELKCVTETGRVIRLMVLHPHSLLDYDNDCANLAHEAKKKPALWRNFWRLKELFSSVKYAYAITAHRSQGSTYETAFVDFQDILFNRNRKEAFQCLYVACSRPTTRLFLA
jgi:exodeoxyribonuclease-5